MKRITRIKGGEKNEKSGTKWSQDELRKVLQLYISTPQIKIHEVNKDIQKLSQTLSRTTRSVEAQLLMFRNLDRNGNYSYKNMNSLSRALWKEYIDKQTKK